MPVDELRVYFLKLALLVSKSFRAQYVEQEALEGVFRVALDVNTVIQVPLHLFVVLLHLRRVLEFHRAEESLFDDSRRHLVVVPDVQLVERFVDAVFQIFVQELLYRLYDLLEAHVLLFVDGQRAEQPFGLKRVELVLDQLAHDLELDGVFFHGVARSLSRLLARVPLMLHGFNEIILDALHEP